MSSPSDDGNALVVVCIGGYAAERMQHAREGRVRAVFERSAYVELDRQWICIGSERLGRGPLNAIVASPYAIGRTLARLAPQQPALGTWPRFRVADALLDCTNATFWHPALPARPIDRARLARGVARMRSAAHARIPAEGLAFVVGATGGTGVLADAGTAAAAALRRWVAEDDAASPPDALRDMIGLGPGLTPSGDDFIGGALVALHALDWTSRARALADALLPLGEGATHPVSVAHLGAAAHGEGSEALHTCLLALAEDRDPVRAHDAIAAIGHTSGWDALAGAMTVAAAIAGN
jgi:hypothetical protein